MTLSINIVVLIIVGILLIPTMIILGVVYQLLLGFVKLLQGVVVVQQTVINYYAKLRNEPTIRRHLDAGLAGSPKARLTYELRRVIRGHDIPAWAQVIVEATISSRFREYYRHNKPTDTVTGFKSAKEYLRDQLYCSSSKRSREYVPVGLLNFMDAQSKWLENLFCSFSWIPEEYRARMTSQLRRLHQEKVLVREINAELQQFIPKSVALEDFIFLHPCSLRDEEKRDVVDSSATIWDMIEHRVLRVILMAEAELQDVFQQYHATSKERATAVRRLLNSGITEKSKQRVVEWFADQRPNPKPVVAPPAVMQRPLVEEPRFTPSPTISSQCNLRGLVKGFVRGLRHLDREQQNHIMHLTLKLHGQGIFGANESIAELSGYTGTDHDSYWELRYHELTAVAQEATSQPIRPTVKPILTLIESPESLLSRLYAAERISYGDMTTLRKLVNQGQITDQDKLRQALELIVCSALVHDFGGRPEKQGPYRIKRKSMVKKYLRTFDQSFAEAIIGKLIREEKLVCRNSGRTNPRPNDAVKLHPSQRYRFMAG